MQSRKIPFWTLCQALYASLACNIQDTDHIAGGPSDSSIPLGLLNSLEASDS